MKIDGVVRKQSRVVWEYLKIVTKNQKILRYGEQTITEELIREIYLLGKSKIVISPMEKPESVTGADFFWTILCNDGLFRLAFQAKKLYAKNSKYNTINHKVQGKRQIDIFEEYSKKTNRKPYYLLYNANYLNSFINYSNYKHADPELINNRNAYLLGITVAKLSTLKLKYIPHVQIPTFDDITLVDTTRTLRSFINELCGFSLSKGNESGFEKYKPGEEAYIVEKEIEDFNSIKLEYFGEEEIEINRPLHYIITDFTGDFITD